MHFITSAYLYMWATELVATHTNLYALQLAQSVLHGGSYYGVYMQLPQLHISQYTLRRLG